MFRYRIDLSYRGTNYHGWQIQENARTVQYEINKALSLLLSEDIETVGCGRTDTGVHAKKYIAHFDSLKEIDSNTIVYKLNGMLGADIAIHKILVASPDFHARFGALSRKYKYFVHLKKNPFLNDSSYFCPYILDLDKMNLATQFLLGCRDFTSFSKSNTDTKTNICTIEEAEWISTENGLEFSIVADRFLRNMVRAITGTFIDIGRGKLETVDMERIICSEDRSKAGPSVPAKGLFLWDVRY